MKDEDQKFVYFSRCAPFSLQTFLFLLSLYVCVHADSTKGTGGSEYNAWYQTKLNLLLLPQRMASLTEVWVGLREV